MNSRQILGAATIVAIWPAFVPAAVRGRETAYLGGTVQSVAPNVSGTLMVGDAAELIFQNGEARTIRIPWSSIRRIQFTQKSGRRVGLAVLAGTTSFGVGALPVLLSKKKRHFVTIWFHDAQGALQTAIFEISKDQVRTVLPALEARTGKTVEIDLSTPRGRIETT